MEPLLAEALQNMVDEYTAVTGRGVIHHLEQLAESLKGAKVVHVNSTLEGGGVAEILVKLVPLMAALELDVSWEVIEGNPGFYRCTKGFHNALQGHHEHVLVAAEFLQRNHRGDFFVVGYGKEHLDAVPS